MKNNLTKILTNKIFSIINILLNNLYTKKNNLNILINLLRQIYNHLKY